MLIYAFFREKGGGGGGGTGVTLHSCLPLTATSLHRELVSLPKVAVGKRLDCMRPRYLPSVRSSDLTSNTSDTA